MNNIKDIANNIIIEKQIEISVTESYIEEGSVIGTIGKFLAKLIIVPLVIIMATVCAALLAAASYKKVTIEDIIKKNPNIVSNTNKIGSYIFNYIVKENQDIKKYLKLITVSSKDIHVYKVNNSVKLIVGVIDIKLKDVGYDKMKDILINIISITKNVDSQLKKELGNVIQTSTNFTTEQVRDDEVESTNRLCIVVKMDCDINNVNLQDNIKTKVKEMSTKIKL